MIGQSQSGTGKTAAFVLTMLSRVDYNLNKPQVHSNFSPTLCCNNTFFLVLQAICLAPSRELARQIMSVITSMGKYTNVQTEYAIKDNLPRDASNITAQIIVGTPGTMADLMRRKVRVILTDSAHSTHAHIDKVLDVSHVRVFVLDEADNMLDQDGLGEQTLRVKKYVIRNKFLRSTLTQIFNSYLKAKPLQIILFSATFPDHVRAYAAKIAPNANKIELQKEELSVENIRQFYMDCKNEEHKYDILVSLYQLLTIGQSIIFCQVRWPVLQSVLFLLSEVFFYCSIDTLQTAFRNV
jgi:ATP-dependent RNA helicase DDX19/DBP5